MRTISIGIDYKVVKQGFATSFHSNFIVYLCENPLGQNLSTDFLQCGSTSTFKYKFKHSKGRPFLKIKHRLPSPWYLILKELK